jgi:hypothetical protein
MTLDDDIRSALRSRLDQATVDVPDPGSLDARRAQNDSRARRSRILVGIVAIATTVGLTATALQMASAPSTVSEGADRMYGGYRVAIDVRLEGDAPFTLRAQPSVALADPGTATHRILFESSEALFIDDIRWTSLHEEPDGLFATAGHGCGYSVMRPSDSESAEPIPPDGQVAHFCQQDLRILSIDREHPFREKITLYGGLEDRPAIAGTFELRQPIAWWHGSADGQGSPAPSGDPDGSVVAVVTYVVSPDGVQCETPKRVTAFYNVSGATQASAGEALDYWFSWNDVTFTRDELDLVDDGTPAFVLQRDGRRVLELRLISGYRIVGYSVCAEWQQQLFVISEMDRQLFGPLATMPECEPVGRAGYSTEEAITEPDDPSPCRADGDDAVIHECGSIGMCGRSPPPHPRGR